MPKRKPGKKHPNKVYAIYEAQGDKVTRKNKSCPKCGAGVFLAQHKNRVHCGKCGYTEFLSKKEEKFEKKKEKR